MNKRIRKKTHVGEFQEFGAEVVIVLRSSDRFDDFLDPFILEAVESNGLQFGGGGQGRDVSGIVELGRRREYESNLATVTAWLTAHEDVESFRFMRPIDLWH